MTSGWPACSSTSTGPPWGRRTRPLPMRPTGTRALIPNGAHTLTARARDTDGKTTLSALVNVTVANSDYFQNQVLATGFDLPTNIEFLPDGRMLVARAGGQDQGPAAAVHDPGPDPVPADHQHRRAAGCSRGSSTSRSIPTSPPTTTTTSSTRSGRRNADRLSRFTANASAHRHGPGSELVLYQDPGSVHVEHHGGAVNFGNDGKLYFTTGDHFAGTPSQDLNSPRGKIHRIDKDGFVPTRQPVLRRRRPQLGLGLGLWPAQSVPSVLRRPHQPALHRRRRRQRRATRTRS